MFLVVKLKTMPKKEEEWGAWRLKGTYLPVQILHCQTNNKWKVDKIYSQYTNKSKEILLYHQFWQLPENQSWQKLSKTWEIAIRVDDKICLQSLDECWRKQGIKKLKISKTNTQRQSSAYSLNKQWCSIMACSRSSGSSLIVIKSFVFFVLTDASTINSLKDKFKTCSWKRMTLMMVTFRKSTATICIPNTKTPKPMYNCFQTNGNQAGSITR